MTPNSDINTSPTDRPATPGERRWAVLRIVLGTAQIMMASVSLYLLLQMGMKEWSVGAVVVTALLVVVSKALFRES